MNYYIGIDGGGTKTDGVLTSEKGRVLARAAGGASNPNDVTPEGALSVISGVIRLLLSEAGLSETVLPAVSIFVGVAGGINYGPALKEGLDGEFPTARALGVSSDVQILLSGELPLGDGACIICGTGSACFLRRGTELIRIGGWGYLLDSGGSGYDMGREALEAVLRAHDGRGEPTRLTELVTKRLGGEAHTRITEIYREGKPYIAACAPCVFEAAAEGDPVATAILRRNARALAEYIEAAWRWLTAGVTAADVTAADGTAADKTPPPTTLPVIMGGGISGTRADTWPALVASLTDPRIPLALSVATARPVFGAAAEAKKQCDPTVTISDFADFRAAFVESYASIPVAKRPVAAPYSK